MSAFNGLIRFLIAFIAGINLLLIFLIPKFLLVSFSSALIYWVSLAIVICSFFIYMMLVFGWFYNSEVDSLSFIKFSRIFFLITLAIGIIATDGYGFVFVSFPISLCIYLLFAWYPDQYNNYLKSNTLEK